jgi:hypothetical protein
LVTKAGSWIGADATTGVATIGVGVLSLGVIASMVWRAGREKLQDSVTRATKAVKRIARLTDRRIIAVSFLLTVDRMVVTDSIGFACKISCANSTVEYSPYKLEGGEMKIRRLES